MKKSIVLLMAVIIVAVSLNSCSEDDSPTNGSIDIVDYFPMEQNSWWKYENHVLDTADQKPIGDAEYDSVAVTNEDVDKLGKTAYEFTTWDIVDGKAQDPIKDYFYMEGDQLYAFSDLISRQLDLGTSLPIPIEIDDRWVKIADPNEGSWEIFEQKMEGVPIDLGVPTSFTGDFKITGNKKETATDIAENNVTTQRYEILFVIKGIADAGVLGSYDLLIEARYSVWFAEGIGIVKTELKPFKAVIKPPIGNPIEMPFEGAQSVLKDHNVPQAVQ